MTYTIFNVTNLFAVGLMIMKRHMLVSSTLHSSN